jgi:hypothetical protein
LIVLGRISFDARVHVGGITGIDNYPAAAADVIFTRRGDCILKVDGDAF